MVPTERVLRRVADAEGIEPSRLEETLYEQVDTDALDALFESLEDGPTRERGEVRFPYHGYEVVVFADGDVVVRESN
jgi:hypothetical protein